MRQCDRVRCCRSPRRAWHPGADGAGWHPNRADVADDRAAVERPEIPQPSGVWLSVWLCRRCCAAMLLLSVRSAVTTGSCY